MHCICGVLAGLSRSSPRALSLKVAKTGLSGCVQVTVFPNGCLVSVTNASIETAPDLNASIRSMDSGQAKKPIVFATAESSTILDDDGSFLVVEVSVDGFRSKGVLHLLVPLLISDPHSTIATLEIMLPQPESDILPG